MPGAAGRFAPSVCNRARIFAWGIMLLLAGLLATPATAQTFPQLTGRVVDAAGIIPDDEEARLTQKLAALEAQTKRQLVVVTLPDLQGYEISDYGYRLGREWGLGDKERNDGALLIVAPKERRVRIEVGYGLEGVLTDGLSSLIIQQQIVPRFKAGDMPGGIEAGTDALIRQLALPADQAAQNVAAAEAEAKRTAQPKFDPSAFIWLGFFFLFFILPMLRRARGGRYRGSGLGPIILWSVLDAAAHSGRRGGSGWGGGGGSDWGGGGFSGGGGSFGGGGASGSW